MTRLEAYEAMKQGHKVTHRYFSDDEYLHIVNRAITSEDGYNFRDWFNDGMKWKEDGWSIWNDKYGAESLLQSMRNIKAEKWLDGQ